MVRWAIRFPRTAIDLRACLVVMFAILLSSAGPVEGSQLLPSVAPGGTGSLAPAAADDRAVLALEQVDDPDLARLEPDSRITAIAEGDGVLVALAECGNAVDSPECLQVLRSTDGLDWEVVLGPLLGYPFGVAGSEDGFLMIFNDTRQAKQVVYRSTDGRTWTDQALSDADYLEGVAAGPSGYVGLGCDRSCEHTVPWRSTDGRLWARDGAYRSRLRLSDVATGEDTLVGVAGAGLSGTVGAIALFEDQWVELDLPLPERADIAAVAAMPDGGFAIAGHVSPRRGPSRPFLLTSPDGLNWDLEPGWLDLGLGRASITPTDLAAGPGIMAMTIIAEGAAARAAGIGEQSVAWSTDGADWRLAELPAPRGAEAYPDTLLVTRDGRVIAAGTTEGRDREPAIWVGGLTQGEAPPGATGRPGGTLDAPTGVVEVGDEVLTGATRRDRARQEQELLALAGYPSCRPYRARGEFDPFEFGATAAVQCDAPEQGVEQVAVFGFPDGTSLEEWWGYRMRSITVPLPASDAACLDGRPGQGAWEAGTVACYVTRTRPEAQVRWTDESTSTYWLADATHRDMARLARWWAQDRP